MATVIALIDNPKAGDLVVVYEWQSPQSLQQVNML